MIPYRIFISYSHNKSDAKLVRKIGENLEDEGLIVMWDQKFSVGTGFHEQIKSFINHSHVFLPIITKSSNRRGWVHQEIGYAVANNIPVLPLAVEILPDAMMRELHAILVPRNSEKIKERLKYEVFSNLVRRYENPIFATYQCAEFTEDRAKLMSEYAREIVWMKHYGEVRQKGGLSSFHIPNEVINDKVWIDRYGDHKTSSYHCRCQRDERLALEEHASVAGCKIIIDPTLSYDAYGKSARILRLKCLKKFLTSPTGEKAQVAFYDESNSHSSITIVGDWFYSESHSGKQGKGYHQTIFTRHAPSIKHHIDLFDQEFNELQKIRGWDKDNCRDLALEEIDKNIVEIKS